MYPQFTFLRLLQRISQKANYTRRRSSFNAIDAYRLSQEMGLCVLAAEKDLCSMAKECCHIDDYHQIRDGLAPSSAALEARTSHQTVMKHKMSPQRVLMEKDGEAELIKTVREYMVLCENILRRLEFLRPEFIPPVEGLQDRDVYTKKEQQAGAEPLQLLSQRFDRNIDAANKYRDNINSIIADIETRTHSSANTAPTR